MNHAIDKSKRKSILKHQVPKGNQPVSMPVKNGTPNGTPGTKRKSVVIKEELNNVSKEPDTLNQTIEELRKAIPLLNTKNENAISQVLVRIQLVWVRVDT